jgi:hypothetical protein
MDAQERLLNNINSQFAQNEGFDTINEAIQKEPNLVMTELIDMVCSICDELNK